MKSRGTASLDRVAEGLASLQDAARFFSIPVVSLADSLNHRLRILHPFGIKIALPATIADTVDVGLREKISGESV